MLGMAVRRWEVKRARSDGPASDTQLPVTQTAAGNTLPLRIAELRFTGNTPEFPLSQWTAEL